jgi:DNA-binding NarL/FixJ family response regulator
MSLPPRLTPRELEVLRLVALGLDNAQIADRLVISPHTLQRHVSSIYAKLGGATRPQAIVYAFTHRLVDLPTP